MPAQWVTALLALSTALLLAYHAARHTAWGARPTELNSGGVPTHRIDLNWADVVELQQLPGIGAKKAEAIERHRTAKGGIQWLEDLDKVPGIGPSQLGKLQASVRTDGQGAEKLSGRVSGGAGTNPVRPIVAGGRSGDLNGLISVNQASALELQKLPGIGPKMSQRIIEERERRPFASIEDLRRVRGIGPKTLEALRPRVIVELSPPRLAGNDPGLPR